MFSVSVPAAVMPQPQQLMKLVEFRKQGGNVTKHVSEILAGDCHSSTVNYEEFAEPAQSAQECQWSQIAERNVKLQTKNDTEGLD